MKTPRCLDESDQAKAAAMLERLRSYALHVSGDVREFAALVHHLDAVQEQLRLPRLQVPLQSLL